MDSFPAHADEPIVGRPWVPSSLEGELDETILEAHFVYVVIEEILEDRVRTIVSAWPLVAPNGQLRFRTPEDASEYVDPRPGLEALLAERRLVGIAEDLGTHRELAARRLATGDTFAMRGWDGGGGGGPTSSGNGDGSGGLLAALRRPGEQLYDITLEARLAAKAAYWSAVAGALDPDDAERFFDLGGGQSKGHEPPPTDDEGGPPKTPSPTSPSAGPSGKKKKPKALTKTAAVAGTPAQQRRELAGHGAE